MLCRYCKSISEQDECLAHVSPTCAWRDNAVSQHLFAQHETEPPTHRRDGCCCHHAFGRVLGFRSAHPSPSHPHRWKICRCGLLITASRRLAVGRKRHVGSRGGGCVCARVALCGATVAALQVAPTVGLDVRLFSPKRLLRRSGVCTLC